MNWAPLFTLHEELGVNRSDCFYFQSFVLNGIQPSPVTKTGGQRLACITLHPVAARGGCTIIPHSGEAQEERDPFVARGKSRSAHLDPSRIEPALGIELIARAAGIRERAMPPLGPPRQRFKCPIPRMRPRGSQIS
jgi:hypothetical protein